MAEAVVALITKDNLILAVSRKYDHEAFGLPGGGVEDFDESDEDALKREIKEETGVEIDNLKCVFTRAEGEFKVKTFTGTITGEPKAMEDSAVKWVTPDVLANGPFGEFNKKLFEVMKINFE